MLPRNRRITAKQEFDLVFKKGEKHYSPYFVVYTLPIGPEEKDSKGLPITDLSITESRCGFITSKKVGGAVERNHARRVLSEIMRALLPELKQQLQIVFVAFDRIGGADFQQVTTEVKKALAKYLAEKPAA